MEKVKILGIDLSILKKNEALDKIKGFLGDGQKHFIVTPNPEIVLKAQKDEELFYILNKADIAITDGFGLKIAAFLNKAKLERITGADLTQNLLKICEQEKTPVGFVIWKNGFSSKKDLEIILQKKYPNLIFSIEAAERHQSILPPEDFFSIKPEIVFCSFGSPWQEKFAFHSLKIMPGVKITMGVGGAIDFLTGKAKRAPKIFRLLGLEWVWRLIKQPNRFKRILNAIIVFSWLFFKMQFILPFFYRPNVCCFLYKKERDKYKILIVERQDEPGHWQLPQGGIEKDDLLIAGARELREELNSDKFITKRVYKNLYRYKFSEQQNRKDTPSQRHRGYKGQKQGLFIAEFIGQDKDIKINFWDHCAWKWVDSDNLVYEVSLIRRRATEIFLKKFKEFIKQK